ncbi:MAG TPA: bifunctional UDP-N-acetylglucosamine diphosphorylase/glucosamine-1-phosphate N-acetyltransferase GlmU [Ramlibacter sp.]|uniref:bifunctional UDP-N-acetylglucosamine diphosphorylase/glucosamine-1-phosphate N-acetyltransferase GlmU n=1 Tax=Ramlibacter sp. TaxID=1917967 RepID=UPI002CDA0EC0|nr:bifunctional UDP-N-acetylglucosamine diphosphorylase/glucosamine-1-phosphate N-acetyltransferase GlmU [Ramlibacter sp.]HVZ42363.1 bifunctional UDP-N-acetylglucosamine diphosphorylase/glucosamine-1-phosphate N-acetyltransferase GlmU [Ramlibacter sp.]
MPPVDVVIMAAGKGTRMKSAKPKVLHRLAGRPLIEHVLEAVALLGARQVAVVTGHGAQDVEDALARGADRAKRPAPAFVRQEPQLGTGHAVMQALPLLEDDGVTLVLNGDVPLVEPGTLQALVDRCGPRQLVLLSVVRDDPTGYGRILRSGEAVWGIVEQKDANEDELSIREVYTGVLAAPTALLKRWLPRIGNRNAQGEYYLTDVVKIASEDGADVVALKAADLLQVEGINSPHELAALERAHQRRKAHSLMDRGVRFADPERFDLRGTLECGQDVEIDVNCLFEGDVSLGDGVRIGANCVVANARIEAGAVIHPFTHIDGERSGVVVGEGALVGPFARLRPGANLAAQVHVGNFVEIKNSTLGHGAKANHLAYLGDATVGERVNYGAGSITANYDGANKHRTVVEADAHIGSNCVLVAPVSIGEGATVGAGSVITKDAPAGKLSVARGRQVTIEGWKRPAKGG